MLLLAAATAAALGSEPQAPRTTSATAQARAIVRIVSAVRVSFDKPLQEGLPQLRQTLIRAQDARLQPAKLIEFE